MPAIFESAKPFRIACSLSLVITYNSSGEFVGATLYERLVRKKISAGHTHTLNYVWVT